MGWFEMVHRSVAYNYTDCDAQKHQYGGNVIFSINNVANHVMNSDKEPTGLGRWTWTKYWRQNDIHTQMVCAYCPCLPMGMDKVHSVYAQHQQFFQVRGEDLLCPKEAFIRDLSVAIDQWLAEGDQIILAVDANEDKEQPHIPPSTQ